MDETCLFSADRFTRTSTTSRLASPLPRGGSDLEAASRLAHTLKGAAGTIGAGALQQSALELQLLCGDSAPADEIETALAGVLAELAPVIVDLERFVADEPGRS